MIGKWIGGLFGLLWGASIGFGFLGLVFGIWLGSRFDRALGQTLGAGTFHRFQQHRHSATQEIFFLATFEVMGHIAKADGRVSRDEIAVAEAAMTQFGLDGEARKKAIAAFDRGKDDDFVLGASLGPLKSACWSNPVLLRLFVEFQFRMAMADGAPGPKKQQILKAICASLGLAVDMGGFGGFHQQQRGSYQQHSQGIGIGEAYRLLDIESHASPAEIKKAYRRKMAEHHPDRLVAKGLPEEMIKLATEKTQAIQKAYETIKKARGL